MKEINILNSILAQAKKPDYETRLYLIEELAKLIRTSKTETSTEPSKLSELNKLGSDIWNGVDLDKYVQQQRQT